MDGARRPPARTGRRRRAATASAHARRWHARWARSAGRRRRCRGLARACDGRRPGRRARRGRRRGKRGRRAPRSSSRSPTRSPTTRGFARAFWRATPWRESLSAPNTPASSLPRRRAPLAPEPRWPAVTPPAASPRRPPATVRDRSIYSASRTILSSSCARDNRVSDVAPRALSRAGEGGSARPCRAEHVEFSGNAGADPRTGSKTTDHTAKGPRSAP